MNCREPQILDTCLKLRMSHVDLCTEFVSILTYMLGTQMSIHVHIVVSVSLAFCQILDMHGFQTPNVCSVHVHHWHECVFGILLSDSWHTRFGTQMSMVHFHTPFGNRKKSIVQLKGYYLSIVSQKSDNLSGCSLVSGWGAFSQHIKIVVLLIRWCWRENP